MTADLDTFITNILVDLLHVLYKLREAAEPLMFCSLIRCFSSWAFRDFVEGYTENLMAELQLEKSLKHHEDIAEEIECIEKTLLKRRAELREADRLLTEAEMELESTRGKASKARSAEGFLCYVGCFRQKVFTFIFM